MQNYQRSFFHFQRHQLFFRPARFIKSLKPSATAVRPEETGLQSCFVSPGYCPQTSVFNRRVFEREPQTQHSQRFGKKKRPVLMATYFTTDIWLFEDIHRL